MLTEKKAFSFSTIMGEIRDDVQLYKHSYVYYLYIIIMITN